MSKSFISQAVILAGGKGTRLASRLAGLPKPLIEVAGKALLERQIELLVRYGIRDLVLLVSHGAEQIERFCQAHPQWGVQITYLRDTTPLGTAGSVIAALPQLDEAFLVLYGDVMLDVDLARFTQFHQANANLSASLFLHPNDHPKDSDIVEVNTSGMISAFHPYPHPPDLVLPNLVNAGLYALNKAALLPFSANSPHSQALDFGRDLFPLMLAKDAHLAGYISPEYIKDCGTPERIDQVTADWHRGRITARNLVEMQAAVFIDRDGTLNQLPPAGAYITQASELTLLPHVGSALAKLNRSNYLSVVVTNQPVIARGDCTLADLQTIHNQLETLLGQDGAYLDQISYCPHHPDAGFAGEVPSLKGVCACRKPATALITQACATWHINPLQSWFVGDSTADFLAAKRAGLRSVGVETGEAGLDGKYPLAPQFRVPDFAAAVAWILEGFPSTLAWCLERSRDVKASDVVLIGGLSRSGKSTAAVCLQAALQLRGLTAHIVPTDAYLKTETMRSAGVLGRYDMAALQALFQQLQKAKRTKTPVEVALGFYDKTTRTVLGPDQTLLIHPQDVVIIEGVVALSLAPTPVATEVHTWYVTLDELARQKRVLREYQLRGETLTQAQARYAARLLDETPIIEAFRTLAQQTVDLQTLTTL
jgi:histidinol-phosphate phosphatase family protein